MFEESDVKLDNSILHLHLFTIVMRSSGAKLNVVRSLIREILKEDAYKEMTGKRFTADIEAVRDTVGEQGYFLHFTDTPKIGVNPKSIYVPGVYFYPNTQEIYDAFFKDASDYYRGAGRAARYVYLVKLKPGLKIVEGDGINEKIKGLMQDSLEPILSAGLDDSIYRARPKFFNAWHEKRSRGLSGGVDLKYPSIEEMRGSGMLDKVMKNFEELSQIHQLLKNRPRMTKEEQRIAFLKDHNDRLNRFIGKFGSGEQGVDTLKSLDSKDVSDHLKSLEGLLSYAGGTLEKRNSPTKKYVLDLDRLAYHLRDYYSVPLNGVSMKPGKQSGGIALGTIALSSIPSAVLSYAEHIVNHWDLRNMIQHIKWLYSESSNAELSLKSGGTVTLGELKRKCVAALEAALGASAKSLRAAVRRDDTVGTNIILALSGGEDGVNDTGRGGALDVVYGHGGILGIYEGKQLFLKAPIGDKVDIVTMIDRFEGKPDSWKVPGSPTPDREAGFEKDKSEFDVGDGRVAALKSRFARKTGEETLPSGRKVDTTTPTERWAAASKDD